MAKPCKRCEVLEKAVAALRSCYDWDRAEYQSSEARVAAVEDALAALATFDAQPRPKRGCPRKVTEPNGSAPVQGSSFEI